MNDRGRFPMPPAATSSSAAGLGVADTGFDASFMQARLRLHQAVVPSAVGASALAGGVTAVMLWPAADGRLLLAWLATLGAALALRLALWTAQRRGAAADPAWLLRYRVAYLVHGMVWGLPALLLTQPLGAAGLAAVVFACTAVAAGAVVTSAHDRLAAALFSVPALLLLLLLLWVQGDAAARTQGVMALLLVAIVAIGTLRTHRSMREAVLSQQREAARADEARRLAAAAEAARRDLADQHRLLAQLLQTTLQGCWFIDTEGRSTQVNDAMCALLGRTREEIIGRSVFDFFSGADLQTLRREFASRRTDGAAIYELDIVRPDGTRLHCRNHATPIWDAEGRHVSSVGLWSDLTAHIRAERELRTYELVSNSITDVVSVIDEDEVYRMVNDAWCRHTGIARGQALGRRTAELMPTVVTSQRHQTLVDCLHSGQVRKIRGKVDLPALSGCLIETSFYPYGSGAAGARCVVMVSRDVTEQEQSRLDLEASAEYLRRTLNATGDAIFASDATDMNQPVRFANDQVLKMFGIPQHLAATLTPADIMAHAVPLFADPEGQSRRVAEIIAGNLADESRVPLRDGRVLLRRCMPARVGDRRVRVWSLRDITAVELALQVVQARDSEQRALLDAFPGYIGRLGADLVYTYVNERLARLLGGTPAQVIGRSVRELVGPQREAVVRQMVERARGGEHVQFERLHEATADHPATAAQVTLVSGTDPGSGASLVYAFGIDITARKQAEAAVIAARDEAERANRAKSHFLSQMSHELRTPMNAIMGFAQLLQSDPRAALADHQQGYVREIMGGARHLLELINEVLDLGRIESGHLVLESSAVPLPALIDECLGLVGPLALLHGVQLLPPRHGADGLGAEADRTRLKQVLLNLLANAIKYNRPAGEVEVLCRAEGGLALLAVRDTGRGLTLQEQQRLFQPFERLSAAQAGIEGTGIGLALSHRLMQAMGGEIGVDSQPGVGSTFWVRLPLGRAGAPAARERSADAPDASDTVSGDLATTVLYIEDNAVNVLLMEAMLERVPGVRLVSATLPAEGLKMAIRRPPALILLDIQMPGMDGFEVLRRLRARASTRRIPVIAVSANALQADIDVALAAGFSAYLTKPLELGQLLATVQAVLQDPAPPGAR